MPPTLHSPTPRSLSDASPQIQPSCLSVLLDCGSQEGMSSLSCVTVLLELVSFPYIVAEDLSRVLMLDMPWQNTQYPLLPLPLLTPRQERWIQFHFLAGSVISSREVSQKAQGCLLWVFCSVISGFLPGTFWGTQGTGMELARLSFFFSPTANFLIQGNTYCGNFCFAKNKSRTVVSAEPGVTAGERLCRPLQRFDEHGVGVEGRKAASHQCPQVSSWNVWVCQLPGKGSLQQKNWG